jgi:hypothetical protein
VKDECYGVYLGCDLAVDGDSALIDEVRWHLGITDTRPDRLTFLGVGDPPSGPVASLADATPVAAVRPHPEPHSPGEPAGRRWALHWRAEFPADALAAVTALVSWLAGHCATQGWIGFIDDGLADRPVARPPSIYFFVQDRRLYGGHPGTAPLPMESGYPPYLLPIGEAS